MIVDHFQPCSNVSPAIMRCLKRLSETKYPELYENGDGKLEDDIRATLMAFANDDKSPDKASLIWLGWSLCLASIPTIEWVKKDDPRPSLVRAIFNEWKERRSKSADLWSTITFEDVGSIGPQNLSEALLVLKCQKNIYLQKFEAELVEYVAESIDLCLQGYAIAAGLADRRPILNWMINYVMPCAHSMKSPDVIYTIVTVA